MAEFYTLLTPTGLAKITNAQLTASTVNITQVAIGDASGAGYKPTGAETALKREVWRGGITNVNTDADNPNWVVVESVVPATVGGFTIREIALFDADGDMIAIGNYPDAYKPVLADGSTMDLVLRTIIEVSNADSVTMKIDPNVTVASRKFVAEQMADVTEQLDQTKQAAFINVKDYGAKGDYDFTLNIGTDDTMAFMMAKALAETLRKKVYAPSGVYLIKDTYVIADLASNGIFGDGKQQTILIFDLQDGQTAIEANTHYFRQSEIRDLRIQNRNENLTINGVRIGPDKDATWSWGAGCNLINVDIARFTGVFLLLDEAFNGMHENSRFYGVYNSENEEDLKGTALKISTSNTAYSNVNSFKNCVFHLAKIGIQNLNGTMLKFDTCTFESLTLWQNLVANNRITPFEIFQNCWFEKITKGFVNAAINEDTLEPQTPIVDKASIDNVLMINNYMSGGVTSAFLDANVNTNTNWSPINGWVYGKELSFRSATLLNGWTGTLEYQKSDRGLVMIKVYVKPPANIATGSTALVVGKIANLEAGFRPNSSCVIPVRDATGAIKHIFISNNGDVFVANDATFVSTDNHTGQATYYGA